MKNDDFYQFGNYNLKWIKNKYVIASIIFLLWVLFIDQNNLVERFQNLREKNRLENEKEYYVEKKSEDAARLKELKTNNENLEKFAREQYYMKKKDEDVYIIIEEK